MVYLWIGWFPDWFLGYWFFDWMVIYIGWCIRIGFSTLVFLEISLDGQQLGHVCHCVYLSVSLVFSWSVVCISLYRFIYFMKAWSTGYVLIVVTSIITMTY